MFDELGYPMNPEGAFQPRGGRGSRMRLHGGKGGGSAPAPDPRLVSAQIESMGVQNSAIQQVMKNSNDLAPMQRQQLEDSITRGTALYGQSQEDRAYGLQRRGVLTGLQDQMVTDAQTYNTEGRREQLASQAVGDVTQAFDQTRQMGNRGLQRMGIDPNSGRALAVRAGGDMAEAAARASAANKTRQAARLEGFQLNDRASNAFSGYPASTASSIGSGLSTAGFGLNSANTGLDGMNSGYKTAGGLAGQMGQNAAGMYGAQANYKNSQDQIASQNDPMNTILGAAAGVGTKIALSDRRAKTEISRVGTMPNGLPIYTYRYKTGGPVQMGVMADEVAQIAPQAYVPGGPGQYDAVNYAAL